MKIGLDFGHGVNGDGGAVGLITEQSLIDTIGVMVKTKLEARGHTVILTRPATATSTSNSLQKRCDTANNNRVDLFASIHANVTVGGAGTEVFTYGGQKTAAATRVLNNICAIGFKNRGIKDGSGLYVINGTNMEAMLIEVCFIDSPADVALYNGNKDRISEAIAQGLTNQVAPTAPPPVTTPPPTGGSLWTIQVGAFAVEANADNKLNEVKKYFPDAFKKKIQ